MSDQLACVRPGSGSRDEHHNHRRRRDRRPHRGQARRGGRARDGRGARGAPEGDPRTRAHAQGERRRDRRARRGDGSHRRSRRRGSRRARGQGASAHADRSRGRLDRDALDDAHDDAKRLSVVVLLQARRTARGRSARERRSRRSDRSPSADRRRRRRHQLPGGGDREPGRHPAYRRPSRAGRRNRRPKDRAHRGVVRALHESRLQIAGAHRRAFRNLDEALGQSDLQSDKRAHPCDASKIICRFRARHARSRRR